MTGLIVPRPVALVSTIDKDGVANVAPFSFFAGVGSNPPTVLFCPTLRSNAADRPDDRKDTLRNVEQTGEFVINVVSTAIAEASVGINIRSDLTSVHASRNDSANELPCWK